MNDALPFARNWLALSGRDIHIIGLDRSKSLAIITIYPCEGTPALTWPPVSSVLIDSIFLLIFDCLHSRRHLMKRTGLVLCDPSALEGRQEAAISLVARAVEAKGTIEHSRLLGVGPSGGLHIFKWKSYSH